MQLKIWPCTSRLTVWYWRIWFSLVFIQNIETEIWANFWCWSLLETEVWAKRWHRWEHSTLGSVLLLAMFHFSIRKRHILLSYLASSEPGLGRTLGRITLGSDLGLNNLRPGNSKMAPGALLGHHMQQELANAPILVDQHHQLLLLRNKWIWHLTTGGATATCPQVGLFNVKSNVKRNIFSVFFFSFSFEYVVPFLKIKPFSK